MRKGEVEEEKKRRDGERWEKGEVEEAEAEVEDAGEGGEVEDAEAEVEDEKEER